MKPNTQDDAMRIIAKHIGPCLDKDMQITHDVVTDIIIDCEIIEPFQSAIKTVVKWFNEQHVYDKCDIDQRRYVGATVNLLSLLAIGDLSTLLTNWVFSDMSEELDER